MTQLQESIATSTVCGKAEVLLGAAKPKVFNRFSNAEVLLGAAKLKFSAVIVKLKFFIKISKKICVIMAGLLQKRIDNNERDANKTGYFLCWCN
jgi:hypothetical protein